MTQGLLQVYTGDGKGKTTAAMGLALRAAGRGRRVFIAQFLKGQPTGELTALRRMDDCVRIEQFGTGHFVQDEPTAEDCAAAAEGLQAARSALTGGGYDVVILDEINVAVDLGLVTAEAVLELTVLRPEVVELVLTGRNAPPCIVERADLVTEMRKIRHPYDRGVPARSGIDL